MFRGMFKKAFVTILSLVVCLNFVYFLRRTLVADTCDVDLLLKERGQVGGSASSAVTLALTATEETSSNCEPGIPCVYRDAADLRIIVITYNRWESLLKLLNSLNDLQTDGDRIALEIWIDRSAGGGDVDDLTLRSAESFQWNHGAARVHVQRRHVGIYGQWIDTWRPVGDDELVLFLEDDLSVSPFAYRWLKAARRKYGNRSDVGGFTLQSEGLIVAKNAATFVPRRVDGPVYLYRLVGSWGFAPRPEAWRRFQDWYRSASADRRFRPYVDGVIMTSWYKTFEKQGKANTMWTMWFIYFCNANDLFTVYNNLNALTNTTHSCLAVNRKEPGLHYSGKGKDNGGLLLRYWNDSFVNFSDALKKFGFDGHPLTTDDQSSSLLGRPALTSRTT